MKIGNITINNDGDVSHGLEYLKNKWETEEVKEIFRNARRETDQNTHFSANINGSTMHYILKHNEYDTFFLKPND